MIATEIKNTVKILAPEHRRKISIAHIGLKHSEESKKKMSGARKGLLLSKEHKNNISKALKGRVCSDETRKKISKSHIGKSISQKIRAKISLTKLGKTRGGNPNNWKHNEATKRKMSKAKQGFMHSQETKEQMSKAHKGKTILPEVRKKISIANTGKIHSEERRRKNIFWKGKHFSYQHRKRISDAHKARKKLHHSWKGGVVEMVRALRVSFKYRNWRKAIFERDNYTCQICGDNKGGNLNADHIIALSFILQVFQIKNVDDAESCWDLWDINNGRTLCVDCHKKTDNYGRKANKLTQLVNQ